MTRPTGSKGRVPGVIVLVADHDDAPSRTDVSQAFTPRDWAKLERRAAKLGVSPAQLLRACYEAAMNPDMVIPLGAKDDLRRSIGPVRPGSRSQRRSRRDAQ